MKIVLILIFVFLGSIQLFSTTIQLKTADLILKEPDLLPWDLDIHTALKKLSSIGFKNCKIKDLNKKHVVGPELSCKNDNYSFFALYRDGALGSNFERFGIDFKSAKYCSEFKNKLLKHGFKNGTSRERKQNIYFKSLIKSKNPNSIVVFYDFCKYGHYEIIKTVKGGT